MNLLDTSPELHRAAPAECLRLEAKRLVACARAQGLVLTITTVPRQPPAMGSYDLIVDVMEARHGR